LKSIRSVGCERALIEIGAVQRIQENEYKYLSKEIFVELPHHSLLFLRDDIDGLKRVDGANPGVDADGILLRHDVHLVLLHSDRVRYIRAV
jgi:hypothetical protein